MQARALHQCGHAVMLSTGSGFSEPTRWSDVPFFGNVATLLGAVDGGPRADLVAVGLRDVNPPTDDSDDTDFQVIGLPGLRNPTGPPIRLKAQR